MKKIVIAIGVLALFGAGVGYYMFNKPLESTKSMTAHYSLSAEDLLMAFEEDESAANTKYLDKVLEIKGKVEKIDRKEGSTTVYLDANNPMSNIIFKLEEPNSKIKEGDDVIMKGICTGYLADVILVRALIV